MSKRGDRFFFGKTGSAWLAVLALAVFVVVGLGRISWEVEILKMLPQEIGQVRGLSAMFRHFGLEDELIVTLSGESDPEKLEERARSLAAALEARADLAKVVVMQPPWESDPDGLAELIAFAALNLPEDEFRVFAGSLAPSAAAETAKESLEEIAGSFSLKDVLLLSYDPLRIVPRALKMGDMAQSVRSEFVSGDGKFRVLFVKAAKEFASYRDAGAWIGAVDEEIARWKKVAGAENLVVGVTGEPAFVAEISSGMERDMRASGVGAIALVAFIFWLFYRKLKPLFLIVAMMGVCFIFALAFSGIFSGSLTVIGVGFGSIMIGLSVDYALVVYHLRREHREVGALRKSAFPGIFWSAATTCGGFLALSFAGFPALSQLGVLVAAGAAASAVLALGPFAKIVCREGWIGEGEDCRFPVYGEGLAKAASVALVLLLAGAAAVLFFRGFPAIEKSTRALRSEDSRAFRSMEELERRLTENRRLVNVVVTGKSEKELRERLGRGVEWVRGLERDGIVTGAYLPEAFCPVAELQEKNLALASAVLEKREELFRVLEDAGFAGESFRLSAGIFSVWERWKEGGVFPVFPEGRVAGWLLRRMVDRAQGEHAAMGVLFPADGLDAAQKRRLYAGPEEGVYGVSWEGLGEALSEEIGFSYLEIGLLFCGAMGVLLLFAYKDLWDWLLTVFSVGAAFFALAGTMAAVGWPWNFFSLASLVLIFATGVDYPIHMVFAMREAGGNFAKASRAVGPPLALCTMTTLVGFGSLGFVSNIGLASLGKVCALGVFYNYLFGVFFVPLLWKWKHGKTGEGA